MSTKGSLFLTEDNEHWYHETIDNSLTIEIDPENIQANYSDEIQGVIVEIKPNCDLWKILMSARYRRKA